MQRVKHLWYNLTDWWWFTKGGWIARNLFAAFILVLFLAVCLALWGIIIILIFQNAATFFGTLTVVGLIVFGYSLWKTKDVS